MGKRKITCNNSSCKHHTNGGCDTCITLDGSGKCKSFEKGFAYYFHIVWDALDNKNFIDMVEIRMNPDLKTGLFYVMECYDLGFSEMEWGTCRMVMLKDGKEGKPLKYEEIIEREMNMEKFSKHLENFNNGIMPQMQQEQDAAGQQDKEEKEFGWLSPTGVFTESPFGTHEESAEQICEEKGFTEEYWNWVKENRGNEINHLMRDFLSEVKGYCLIHNPSGYTGYIVTNMKNLTKQQIQILTELTCKSKYQIIGILLRNGEKVPKSIENQLYKRLDALDAQIFECEMEYKEIVTALTGENRRKEHGNRIQRHGRTEQEQ